MNILIIDDSLEIREFLKNTLKAEFEDCKIVEANNSKDGFNSMTKNSFDLIITDMESGGSYLVSRISSSKILRNKKVIIYTSARSMPFSYPNIKLISKSASRDELIKKIKDHLTS